MMRDIEDIVASDKHRVKNFTRISKKGNLSPSMSVFEEKRHQYSKLFYNNEDIPLYDTPYKVYEIWNTIQKKEKFNFYEFDYNLLKQHKLWIPLEDRRNFKKGTQTK